MAFDVKDWKNSPDATTPISAEALEDMEERLSDYTDSVGTGGVELGYAQITSALTSTSSYPTKTDMAGLSVTVTVGARPIIVEAGGPYFSQAATVGSVIVSLLESSTELAFCSFDPHAADKVVPFYLRARLTPAAGSHTYKVALSKVGTGTATLGAGATFPAWIQVTEV